VPHSFQLYNAELTEDPKYTLQLMLLEIVLRKISGYY